MSDDLTNIIIQSQKLIPKAEDEFLDLFNRNNNIMSKSTTSTNRLEKTKNDNLDNEIFFGKLIEENDKKPDNFQKIEFEDYYDFKALNNRKFKNIEKDKLNRIFPNEIENIQKMKETNYLLSKLNLNNNKDEEVSILRNSSSTETLNQSYGRNSHYFPSDKDYSLNMSIHPLLENIPIHQEDIIESYSMVKDIQNKLIDDIPYYRELAPYAREVIYSKLIIICNKK